LRLCLRWGPPVFIMTLCLVYVNMDKRKLINVVSD
jgi:hypothetical protein